MNIAKTKSGILVCAIALLLAGCQSMQSSSSSSSASTPSTSQSSQSSPAASSSSQSSSPSDSQQQSRSEQQSGTEEAAYDEADERQGSTGETASDQEQESGMPDGGEILSEEEAVAVLDEQFDESIAVFDGMIINERATVQAIESEYSDDEEEVFGDDNPLFEEADINEDSDGNGEPASPTEGGGGAASDINAEKGDGTLASGSNSMPSRRAGARVPADIPDGSDDDIVARQIREAAMKEADPVLREKLWEEYRKYKRGQ